MTDWIQVHIHDFKITLTKEELSVHLRTRAMHHQERAEEKEKELPLLKETLAKFAPPKTISMKNSYNTQDDAVEQAEKDIRKHKARAYNFRFFADHLGQDLYTLTLEEARTLELTMSEG